MCVHIPRDNYTIRLGRAVQLVEAPLHEAGGFGFDSPVGSLEIFKWPIPSVCTQKALGSIQALTELSNKEITLGVKCGRSLQADSSAFLVVPNFEVKLEAQHFFLPLSLREFYRKAVPFFTICIVVPLCMQTSFICIDVYRGD